MVRCSRPLVLRGLREISLLKLDVFWPFFFFFKVLMICTNSWCHKSLKNVFGKRSVLLVCICYLVHVTCIGKVFRFKKIYFVIKLQSCIVKGTWCSHTPPQLQDTFLVLFGSWCKLHGGFVCLFVCLYVFVYWMILRCMNTCARCDQSGTSGQSEGQRIEGCVVW